MAALCMYSRAAGVNGYASGWEGSSAEYHFGFSMGGIKKVLGNMTAGAGKNGSGWICGRT